VITSLPEHERQRILDLLYRLDNLAAYAPDRLTRKMWKHLDSIKTILSEARAESLWPPLDDAPFTLRSDRDE
jgi:hypothetical protein